jgi:S-DNA-T family DNA segregation ATPase FtsK/SpoIIIE
VSGLARSAFGKSDTIAPILDELATIVESLPGDRPRVLVVDDLDAMEDGSMTPLWDRLARSDALRVVATMESRNMGGFSMNPMVNEVRKARRALYLQPDDPLEFFQTTGVKPPIRPGTPMPPGRGILMIDRRPTMVQVGLPRLRPAPVAMAGARTSRVGPSTGDAAASGDEPTNDPEKA